MQVVCGSCSSKKAQLQFDENRWHRVCDACHIIFNKYSGEVAEDDEEVYGIVAKLRADRTKTKSILKVNNTCISSFHLWLTCLHHSVLVTVVIISSCHLLT